MPTVIIPIKMKCNNITFNITVEPLKCTKYNLENSKMRRHINNIFIYFVCDMFHDKFNVEYFLILLSDCYFKFGLRG